MHSFDQGRDEVNAGFKHHENADMQKKQHGTKLYWFDELEKGRDGYVGAQLNQSLSGNYFLWYRLANNP